MFEITGDIQAGVIEGARQVPSPNHDARPTGIVVDLLVVHGISLPPNEFGGNYIEQLFTNCLDPGAHPYFASICHQRVSAHALIRRDGSLVQFVNLNDRAWHAGASVFDGRSACNDFSIGIELEGADDVAYTPVQYQVLAQAARAIMRAYPAITPKRIAGHSDIAPGRKTDPGASFDWNRLHTLLNTR